MIAQNHMLPALSRRSDSTGNLPRPDEAHIVDTGPVIAAFPGPAILLGAEGAILSANGHAARLVAALADGGAKEIRVLHATAAATGQPAIGQILLPPNHMTGDPQMLLYLTAIALFPAGLRQQPDNPPLKDRQILVFARDGSAEYAMRHALIESRDLYRDLSRCSSDFAWQTDENGAFTFVSAKGALGYSAQALNGRRSLEMIEQPDGTPGTTPFVTRAPIENVDVAMRDATGDIRYCKIHALPVYDRLNRWRGTRGVSTDITEARLHAAALDAMRQRESHVRAIVDATHRSLDPETAFSDAALILAKATGAIQCSILALDASQHLYVIGASDRAKGDKAALPGLPETLLLQAALAMTGTRPVAFTEEGIRHELGVTAHGGKPNGVIWLQFPVQSPQSPPLVDRPTGAPQPCSLAETVASHIGIAIAHDRQMRRLAELSRTDELTGLMNRRAFMEDLYHRHAHLHRANREGALLYIDLDNFKIINDSFGHATGDRVLQEFANLLRTHSRIGDLSARIGGDEFAVWLEDTDADGAQAKGRHLIEEIRSLPELIGIIRDHNAPKLGLSIGIAIADPGAGEELSRLVKRADDIMYYVKRRGKGGLQVNPPAPHSLNNLRSP